MPDIKTVNSNIIGLDLMQDKIEHIKDEKRRITNTINIDMV